MKTSQLSKAFTLIELLVVIAILALLIAMLIPSLTRAKEVVRRTICQANMRSAAQAWNGFPAMHNGRFPGRTRWSWFVSNPSCWSPQWQGILNIEWYHSNDPKVYPRRSYSPEVDVSIGPLPWAWTFWDSPNGTYKPEYWKTRYIACPNYKSWGGPPGTRPSNQWGRCWVANREAVGGVNWGLNPNTGAAIDEFAGWYGQRLPPDQARAVNPCYATDGTSGLPSGYGLGTRQERFVNAASKFVMFESEYASDDFVRSLTANGRLSLDATSGMNPPWCTSDRLWAFRHMLGNDSSLFQMQAQAPVLYVDGHSAIITPNEPVALAIRFALDAVVPDPSAINP